jgi:hypothetical protein
MHLHEIAHKPKGPVASRELETCSVYLDLGEENYDAAGFSIDSGKPAREGYVKA